MIFVPGVPGTLGPIILGFNTPCTIEKMAGRFECPRYLGWYPESNNAGKASHILRYRRREV